MQQTISYRNLPFRLIGSFFAAGFIVLYGTGLTLMQALRKPAFYIAMLASFIIALCLSAVVHYITKRLDRRYCWWQRLPERAVWQFLLGLCVPTILAIGLAALYFIIMGVNILDTGYFLFDFPIIVGILLVFNLYYVVHYLLKVPHHESKAKYPTYGRAIPKHEIVSMSEKHAPSDPIPANILLEEIEEEPKTIDVYSGSQTVTLALDSEVSFFYRLGKSNWVLTFSGESYLVNRSLEDLQENFCNEQFFRINRQVIVNYDVIQNYSEYAFRRLKLHLNPEYEKLAKNNGFLLVKRSIYPAFKEWYDGKKPIYDV